jgi:hypothetical protein
MTDLLDAALHELVPTFADEQPDWLDVVARAEVVAPARRGFSTRRRLVLALVVLVAVLIPLAALADANDWWFFKTPGSPTPTGAPVVVKTGEWDGHPWQIVAYPSTTDGLCVSMTPKTSNNNSAGAAMGCGPFAGIARTGATKASPDMRITFLSGSATKALPAYIIGPVVEQAATVAIRFNDGKTLHTPTFSAPPPLEHVRFYASPLPQDETAEKIPSPSRLRVSLQWKWIAGLDANGRVVACLAPSSAINGISPLSPCN